MLILFLSGLIAAGAGWLLWSPVDDDDDDDDEDSGILMPACVFVHN